MSTKNSLPLITRDNRGCFLPIALVIALVWIGFCAIVWNSMELDGDDATNAVLDISMTVVALFGCLPLIIAIRAHYIETIEITSSEVKYFKKGWVYITKQWSESLRNYKGLTVISDTGVSSAGVDMDVEVDLYHIALIHATNKRKNVLLEKDGKDKSAVKEALAKYSALLALPII